MTTLLLLLLFTTFHTFNCAVFPGCTDPSCSVETLQNLESCYAPLIPYLTNSTFGTALRLAIQPSGWQQKLCSDTYAKYVKCTTKALEQCSCPGTVTHRLNQAIFGLICDKQNYQNLVKHQFCLTDVYIHGFVEDCSDQLKDLESHPMNGCEKADRFIQCLYGINTKQCGFGEVADVMSAFSDLAISAKYGLNCRNITTDTATQPTTSKSRKPGKNGKTTLNTETDATTEAAGNGTTTTATALTVEDTRSYTPTGDYIVLTTPKPSESGLNQTTITNATELSTSTAKTVAEVVLNTTAIGNISQPITVAPEGESPTTKHRRKHKTTTTSSSSTTETTATSGSLQEAVTKNGYSVQETSTSTIVNSNETTILNYTQLVLDSANVSTTESSTTAQSVSAISVANTDKNSSASPSISVTETGQPGSIENSTSPITISTGTPVENSTIQISTTARVENSTEISSAATLESTTSNNLDTTAAVPKRKYTGKPGRRRLTLPTRIPKVEQPNDLPVNPQLLTNNNLSSSEPVTQQPQSAANETFLLVSAKPEIPQSTNNDTSTTVKIENNSSSTIVPPADFPNLPATFQPASNGVAVSKGPDSSNPAHGDCPGKLLFKTSGEFPISFQKYHNETVGDIAECVTLCYLDKWCQSAQFLQIPHICALGSSTPQSCVGENSVGTEGITYITCISCKNKPQ